MVAIFVGELALAVGLAQGGEAVRLLILRRAGIVRGQQHLELAAQALRLAGESNAAKAWASASAMAGLTAFLASGRSMITVVTGPSFSTRIDMACLRAKAVPRSGQRQARTKRKGQSIPSICEHGCEPGRAAAVGLRR